MNSKIIPLLGLVLIVAAVGFLFRNQLLAERDANLLLPEAQFSQGEMHEKGWGRPKNTKEAINWYLRAAENNHAEAQYSLANLYFEGTSVPQDYNKALIWYLRAANNGHVEAETQLGWMYQRGEGVQVDRVESEKWFSLARERGQERVPPASG